MAINKTLGNLFKGDKVIWMVFFFLCLISAIEVFSASSSLTYKGGSYLAPIVKTLKYRQGMLTVNTMKTMPRKRIPKCLTMGAR